MLAVALVRSCTRQRQLNLTFNLRRYLSAKQGHNDAIIEMLKRERETYSQEPKADGYRIRAFSNAIKVIEQLDEPLTSGKEAIKLKGIGTGIADRINAFIDNQQSLDPSTQAKLRMKTIVRNELLQIPGLGKNKAQELIEAGCKGIVDLNTRKFLHRLSQKQQIYLKYFDHLNKPITREEAETVAKFMRDNLSSKYEIIIANDYRRGLKSFPLLEVILLHPDHVQVPIPDPPNAFNPRLNPRQRLSRSLATRQKYLSVAKKLPNPLHGDAVPNLQSRGLICDTTIHGDRKWSGVIRIPELIEGVGPDGEKTLVWTDKHERIMSIDSLEGAFRQMNIVLTPQKARAATLLAMTGDPEFVKYVRYKALSLGLFLDEFGLWKWHPRSNGEEAADIEQNGTDEQEILDGYWELMQVSTEEDIFSLLGMEYVQPERRNFGYLKINTKRP